MNKKYHELFKKNPLNQRYPRAKKSEEPKK